MSRRRSLSTAAVAVLAACAMMGGPIAAEATASDSSVKADISRALPKLRHDQTVITRAFSGYRNTHSPTRLIKAVKGEDSTLRGLRTELRRESSSSTTGARGKTAIVKGLGLLLQSNMEIDAVLRKHAGHGISASELGPAVKKELAGNKDLQTGVNDLERT